MPRSWSRGMVMTIVATRSHPLTIPWWGHGHDPTIAVAVESIHERLWVAVAPPTWSCCCSHPPLCHRPPRLPHLHRHGTFCFQCSSCLPPPPPYELCHDVYQIGAPTLSSNTPGVALRSVIDPYLHWFVRQSQAIANSRDLIPPVIGLNASFDHYFLWCHSQHHKHSMYAWYYFPFILILGSPTTFKKKGSHWLQDGCTWTCMKEGFLWWSGLWIIVIHERKCFVVDCRLY